MGFFNTVNYSNDPSNRIPQDNSWYAKAESLADACRAPGRWVAAEVWDGGVTYSVGGFMGVNAKSEYTPLADGCIEKMVRVALGVLLAIPGFLLSIPLMSLAFLSEEIRLKHSVSVRDLMGEEGSRFITLINKRQALAEEKKAHDGELEGRCCIIYLLLCCPSQYHRLC